MIIRKSYSVFWMFFLLVGSTIAGCGASGDNGLSVVGKVTVDGLPLEQGTIEFIAEESGRSASTSIIEGRYDFGNNGPIPGTYRIEITSFVSTGKTIEDPDLPGETAEEKRQVISPRYNNNTELQATLPSPEPLDFDLKGIDS